MTYIFKPGTVFSYKLRYIVGFWLVEMAISTNPKPTIYRNLHENTGQVFSVLNKPIVYSWSRHSRENYEELVVNQNMKCMFWL